MPWAGGSPGQACTRPCVAPAWHPLPLPLCPTAHVKAPGGGCCACPGAGVGPLGASRPGLPSPQPPWTMLAPSTPATASGWLAPARCATWSRGKGVGSAGPGHSGQSAHGQTLGDGQSRGPPRFGGAFCGLAPGAQAVDAGTFQASAGFPPGGGGSVAQTQAQEGAPPTDPLVASVPAEGAAGPPEVRVHACPCDPHPPQDSRGAPCVCLCVCVCSVHTWAQRRIPRPPPSAGRCRAAPRGRAHVAF